MLAGVVGANVCGHGTSAGGHYRAARCTFRQTSR
jgi:hypothetical protein